MRGREVRDYDVKPAYPRVTEVEEVQPAKLKLQSSRVPMVQTGRGPVESETYQKIRRAYKHHTVVDYQQRRYYVAKLTVAEGRFEAKLVEAV